MGSNRSERLKKPFTGGMGKVYTSPVKRRAKAKTSTIANHLGQYKKIEALEKKLALLQNPSPPCKQDVLTEEVSVDAHDPELVPDNDEPMDLDQAPDTHPPPLTPSLPLPRKSRGLLPGDDAHKLFDQWKKVLPQLVQSLLSYISTTLGKKWITVTNVASQCRQPGSCTIRNKEVLCLFLSRKWCCHIPTNALTSLVDFETLEIISCECQDVLQTLVCNGLFPTSPSQPRMAISIDLLDFYRALFERSCDAVNALAGALDNFYTRRGFHHRNSKVCVSFLRLRPMFIINRARLSKTHFDVALVTQSNGTTTYSLYSLNESKRLWSLPVKSSQPSKSLMRQLPHPWIYLPLPLFYHYENLPLCRWKVERWHP